MPRVVGEDKSSRSIQSQKSNQRNNFQPIMLKFDIPLLFVMLSIVNLVIFSAWKHIHHCVPKLPFRRIWPNYAICFCQVMVIGVLLFYGSEYNNSGSQENGVEFQLFKDYANLNEDKFKMVRKELATIEFPTHRELWKEMPEELFLLKTRADALNVVASKNIMKDLVFSSFGGSTCRQAQKNLRKLNGDYPYLFTSFNISLDHSIVEWNKVVGQQKGIIKSQWEEEKRKLKEHMMKTTTMAEDAEMYWSSAHVMLRKFMLALIANENEIFVLVYTTPAFLCLFHAFWTGYISIFCTHTPLDSMWRIIMKWLLYIGSVLALILALYQIYLGNVIPSCQPIPNEFHKVRIPAFATGSNINNADFFSKCAQNGQAIFEASNEAILVPRSSLSSNVAVALRNVAGPIFAPIPDIDRIVANRWKLVFPVVAEMELQIKLCPEYKEELKKFVDIRNALRDYMLVLRSSPTAEGMLRDSMDYNFVRIDRLVNNPIDNFNEIVRKTNFKCDDYQNMFESAVKISCNLANVESMELFRIAIFGCLSLISFFYLFYWRRADNSQYWNDPRVRFAEKFMTKHMDDEHHKEWKSINFKNPEGVTYDHFVKNKKKNRYVDIPLIDQSRVILVNHKTDYIHASWIPIPGTDRTYIATQAPLKSTFDDFWHMLIQENVKIVVMLTGFIELDLNICDFYFPGEVGMTKKYGQVEVTCLSIKDSPPEAMLVLTVVRVFQLRDLRNPDAPPQLVTHIHFQNWFAEVVPKFLCRVPFFHRYLDSLVMDDSPIVVHCNSGTERTGVFIAVDYAHELVIQDRRITCSRMIISLHMKNIRRQRTTGSESRTR